ncbi:MAG: CDP-diacylglycerol--glycerol-3-phosphate 3-phosphatidyltransferase [Nocardioides sp.]
MSATEPETKVNNWNVPNALTTLRIVMVPFFAWALLHEGGGSLGWRLVAFVIFTAAMITDKIDGDIARKHNLVTNFGKIADPIADKALTGMAFIGLSIIGELWWWVTVVVLLREWSVTILRLSVMKHVVLAANRSGKVKTVLQTIALCGFILPLLLLDGDLDVVGQVLWYLAAAVMTVAVAMTLWSGWEFVRDARAQHREATRAS